ncbi:VPS10 domain-containing protein [Wenyingzhuangia sp. 2_MG-2023]|uniref:T9SS type A sorting domain-containing protein n=1 Tax=Wenyingzhuangia sp. 2_MG-2023 TaxID=3062639 RepID=UPI0026E2999E|nr:T9SS type A sorting domain-containing protein [Wenyingzhuangia sp. 2_MG-2023]MDO6736338.1 T9SS type A sorting domain-containing protein [Wenyingzhuangia sp. 2_MG-2023]
MKIFQSIFIFFCTCSLVNAQLNTTYFQKLQSQKIASSDKLEWKQFGPGMAGYCEEFWCHPTDVNVLFMSPDMYNSYGSWDNGKSWQTIKDVDGSGKDMRRIQSIIFSHQDADFGFAIDVRGELYKTLDRGRTWSFVKNMGGKHAELTVDPTDDAIWYMGAGDFWNVKANHRKHNDLRGYVYAYADYGHVYKSTDKGVTWQKKKTGLPSTLDVGRIIVDPTNNNNVVIATNSGVYRSTNKGESWELSGAGLPNNSPRDMTSYYDAVTGEFILYLVEQTFYEKSGNSVISKGGIYKSLDGGINWESISGNLAMDLTEITNYNTQNKYWRAIAYWFDVSQAEAKSMYPDYPSSVYSVYNRIVVNPKDKNDIYISHNVKHDYAFGPGDVWKTNDGGQNWFATARSGTYWSEDKNGTYWTGRNNPKGINTEFAHLKYEKAEQEEFYGNRFLEINKDGEVFICLDQQVMRSNNKGVSWKQVDDNETAPGSDAWVGRGASNLPGRFMLLETGVANRKLFCSGEHGLWQSADLGDYPDKDAIAVKQIEGQVNHSGATSISSVAVNSKNPNEIYTLQFRQDHRGQFRRSVDGGKTWSNLSYPVPYGGNLSSDNLFQYSLTVDYNNPNNIYFCVIANPIAEVSGKLLPDDFTGLGVYRSQDGGLTWSIENTGLPTKASVRRIKMDPKNPEVLYAALNIGTDGGNGGLYTTTNKGTNWSKVTIPSSIKAVNNVFVDKTNEYIYISCGREEGSFVEGGVWRSRDNGANWEKIFDMPYIWQTETSPINPNIITVNVALPHENKGATTFNPGAYISFDAGITWEKVNKNLGQPDTITDFKPDPENENVFWIALKGSGWAKGVYKTNEKTIKVSIVNNPCEGVNYGVIKVDALYSGDYEVEINGENFNEIKDFQKEISFTELLSGSYSVAVSSKDNLIDEHYVVVVSEPENIKIVNKNIVKNKVRYQLEGSDVFTIQHNDNTYVTSGEIINIVLEKGENTIEIKGAQDCQGFFTDLIAYGTTKIFPNPAKDYVNIQFDTKWNSQISVKIYSVLGSLILAENFQNYNQQLVVDTSELNTGLYQMEVKSEEMTVKSKLLIK